ncbi:DUF983 domain-containing protein [Arsenicitalea aurantiaca]|uniref:DUF983 domain-containing protein n=1 Tax=Arsenicitalea aurantiaca TaxID=1783274 RepID=A0A433XAS7_9HYPH|nr:DUF983 domain-containing protein [Arsenicitalea aurantiaca]RUT31175.1 DUF983 domain-containing protein [Arsenicitalea aurantiaca]
MTKAATPNPIRAGLLCRCPRCGEGPLFSGFLAVAPGCSRCGLDFGFADSGDGPAIFVIFVAGFAIIALAMVTEAIFHLHPLMHLALWLPGTVLLCLALLRPFKGVMIALQFHNDAQEGRSE